MAKDPDHGPGFLRRQRKAQRATEEREYRQQQGTQQALANRSKGLQRQRESAQADNATLAKKEQRKLKKAAKRNHTLDLGSSIESLKIEKTLDLDALQRTERSLALLAVDNQTRLLEEEECRKHDERRRFEVLEEENLARAEAKKADEERLKLRRVANVDKVALPGLKNKRV